MAKRRIEERTNEERLERLEKMALKWNERQMAIDHNMKHYLKKRMPLRKKLEERRREMFIRINKFLRALPPRSKLVSTSKAGERRTLFLCSHNQAVKLRALLDSHVTKNHPLKVKTNGTQTGNAVSEVRTSGDNE